MRSPPPISRLKCDCACDKPFGTPIAQDSLVPDCHFLMLRAEGIADSVDPMLIPIGAETATTQYGVSGMSKNGKSAQYRSGSAAGKRRQTAKHNR